MAKYNLLDIPLKQAFANSGITQRVPYQLNPNDDDLNWLEGFTDSYQRPVVADDTQQGNGRYIKMGQLNQILQNLSQAFLNVKQGLDNVSKNIDDSVLKQVKLVLNEAEEGINARPYLRLTTNQTAAGLKNFTGVNINNFKQSAQAVANLEWCNGMPFNSFTRSDWAFNTNYTNTGKNQFYLFMLSLGVKATALWQFTLNNVKGPPFDLFTDEKNKPFTMSSGMFVVNKDIIKVRKRDTTEFPSCFTCSKWRKIYKVGL